MSLVVGITNETSDVKIAEWTTALKSIEKTSMVQRCDVTFYGQRRVWDDILSAIAQLPRESVTLAFPPKNRVSRSMPEKIKLITATRMCIFGVIAPSNGIEFDVPPEHLKLGGCCADPHSPVIQLARNVAQNLRSLALSRTGNGLVAYAGDLPKLESLECGSSKCLEFFATKSLEYMSCSIDSPESLGHLKAALAKMPKLYILKITVSRNLADGVLEILRDAELKLGVLTLIGRAMEKDNSGIDWFPHLKTLQMLQISKFRLAATPEELFAELPTIRTVLLRNTKMKVPDTGMLQDVDQMRPETKLNTHVCTEKIQAARAKFAKKHGINLEPVRVQVFYDSNGD
jgi:hypothetical protein